MQAQKNGGFEDWSDLEQSCYQDELDTVYFVQNATSGNLHHWIEDWNGAFFCGTARTTDMHSGDYALVVHNWYMYAWGYVTSRDTISYRPSYLIGHYKYHNEPGAQGVINVILTKFNGTSNDTIGEGTLLVDGQPVYVPFQVDIQYDDAVTVPDSVHIKITSSNQNCAQQMVCNLLYVDDLMLSNSGLAVNDLEINESLLVSPNPFIDNLRVTIPKTTLSGQVRMYNAQGQLVKSIQFNNQSEVLVPRDGLPSGCYFLQLWHDGVTSGYATIVAE